MDSADVFMLKTWDIFLYNEKHPKNCFNDDVIMEVGFDLMAEAAASEVTTFPVVDGADVKPFNGFIELLVVVWSEFWNNQSLIAILE